MSGCPPGVYNVYNRYYQISSNFVLKIYLLRGLSKVRGGAVAQ